METKVGNNKESWPEIIFASGVAASMVILAYKAPKKDVKEIIIGIANIVKLLLYLYV